MRAPSRVLESGAGFPASGSTRRREPIERLSAKGRNRPPPSRPVGTSDPSGRQPEQSPRPLVSGVVSDHRLGEFRGESPGGRSPTHHGTHQDQQPWRTKDGHHPTVRHRLQHPRAKDPRGGAGLAGPYSWSLRVRVCFLCEEAGSQVAEDAREDAGDVHL